MLRNVLISVSCMIVKGTLSTLNASMPGYQKKYYSICLLNDTYNCSCEKPVKGKVLLCDSFTTKEVGTDKM